MPDVDEGLATGTYSVPKASFLDQKVHKAGKLSAGIGALQR